MTQGQFLDTEHFARISRLELVAKKAVEGFVSGKHPSPFHGSSVEYADYRPYTVNDEIRNIDWKRLARTDKYFIKLFEEQTNVRATILLDTSRSMAFGSDAAADHHNKQTYAAYLAATLSYLMLRQYDSVGLVLFNSKVRHYLPPRHSSSHFKRIVGLLENIEPAQDTALGPVLHEMAGRIKTRGMIILISDLLGDVDQLIQGLAHFRHERHEVVVMHVMDQAELTFPFDKVARFKDAEGFGSLVVNPHSVRKRYLKRLEEYQTKVRSGCLERGISYALANTNVPFDEMLTTYLAKRAKMK